MTKIKWNSTAILKWTKLIAAILLNVKLDEEQFTGIVELNDLTKCEVTGDLTRLKNYYWPGKLMSTNEEGRSTIIKAREVAHCLKVWRRNRERCADWRERETVKMLIEIQGETFRGRVCFKTKPENDSTRSSFRFFIEEE